MTGDQTCALPIYGGRDGGRSHASMPFYVSSAGSAVLLNTARVVTADIGTSVRKDAPNRPPSRDRNTDKQWDASPPADAVGVAVPAGGARESEGRPVGKGRRCRWNSSFHLPRPEDRGEKVQFHL